MSNIPESLRYAKSHEWVRIEGDTATIGITDHAQAELTDVVFVELPEAGRVFAVGDNCAVVESVKTASDLYAPVAGTVLEINTALADTPELANDSPFDEGWFFKWQLDGEPGTSHLLDAAGYAAQIGEA